MISRRLAFWGGGADTIAGLSRECVAGGFVYPILRRVTTHDVTTHDVTTHDVTTPDSRGFYLHPLLLQRLDSTTPDSIPQP
jgi:hypothetical protein